MRHYVSRCYRHCKDEEGATSFYVYPTKSRSGELTSESSCWCYCSTSQFVGDCDYSGSTGDFSDLMVGDCDDRR